MINVGSFLSKYVPRTLDKEDTKKQVSDIKTTALKYKKKKPLTKEDFQRPKVDYPSRTSTYVKQFEKKYNMKVSLPEIAKKFNIPEKALKEIYDKGVGAFLSSGSRPNVNAFQWGYARVASVLLGGKSRKIDNHIVEKYNLPLL